MARPHLLVVSMLTSACACDDPEEIDVTYGNHDEPAQTDASTPGNGGTDAGRDATDPSDSDEVRTDGSDSDGASDEGGSTSPGGSDESDGAAVSDEPSQTDDSADSGVSTEDAGDSMVVSESAFRWENPLPLGMSLLSAWSSEAGDLWVGGRMGTMLRCNTGSCASGDWMLDDVPSAADVHALWGASEQQVWAGTDTGLWMYDGSSWESAYSSGDAVTAVWGSAGDDVWAGSSGLLLHFDGDDWDARDLPDGGVVTSLWGASADDVWGTVQESSRETWGVIHFDGSTWNEVQLSDEVASQLSAPSGVEVSVSGSARDDVWVLRQETEGFSPQLVAWHFDGASWSPTLAGNGYARQLHVSAQGDVWILDTEGNLSRRPVDGDAFEPVAEPLPFADTLRLTSLTREPSSGEQRAGDIVAVGRSGLIAAWNDDAGAWSELSSGSRADVDTLWTSGEQVWATGTGYTDSRGNPDLELGPLPLISGMLSDALPPAIVDVWGRAADDLWAIGRQSLHHFDGEEWTTLDESGADHQAIWGSSNDDIWIVGDRTLWRGDGINWDKQVENIADVDGSSADDVWLVIGETARHFDGESFTDYELPGMLAMAVAADGAQAYAAGIGGAAVYSGASDAWEVVLLDASLYAVHASADGDVWAVGSTSDESPRGVVYRFTRGTWQSEPIWVDATLRAVTSDGQRLWVSGDGGVLLSRALQP